MGPVGMGAHNQHKDQRSSLSPALSSSELCIMRTGSRWSRTTSSILQSIDWSKGVEKWGKHRNWRGS